MQLSLRFLLLLIALAAVTVAWFRARQDYAEAQFQILRNTDWNAESVTVPEDSGPPSRLSLDAAGAVNSAGLHGPAGYAAIRQRPGASEQVSGLLLNSMEAIALFDPSEFPNLTWLSFDDAFDIDYSKISLEWLVPMRKLRSLVFYARTSSPLPALATIPQMQSLKLTLWTDQVDTFDDFPQIGGAWMLQIHLPQEHDSVAVSTTLKEQFPDCNIVVWDNFR